MSISCRARFIMLLAPVSSLLHSFFFVGDGAVSFCCCCESGTLPNVRALPAASALPSLPPDGPPRDDEPPCLPFASADALRLGRLLDGRMRGWLGVSKSVARAWLASERLVATTIAR